MKSFYNGSTLKESFCSKGILRIKSHSEWSKNQKKQSSFTCSSKLTVTFVCPEVACGGQLKIDREFFCLGGGGHQVAARYELESPHVFFYTTFLLQKCIVS